MRTRMAGRFFPSRAQSPVCRGYAQIRAEGEGRRKFAWRSMKGRCWSCEKWEQHFYWDHFQESSLRFMKVMNGDFTHKMEFPQKFSKNFRVELIDVVELEAPNGKSWDIGLCKEQDLFYFNGGWKNFVEENEIEEDYILLFEYAGDSSFRVRVFDKTGRLTAASNPNPNPKGSSRLKQKNEDPTLQNIQYSNHSSGAGCVELIGDEERGADGGVGCSRICKEESVEVQLYAKSVEKISLRNSQEIVKKILQLEFSSKEGSCSFVKLITQSNLIKIPYMAIPIKFVKKHIIEKPYGITVFCNESKNKWYVNCSSRNSYWGFCGKSLLKLLQENMIEQGDACVFQLKENTKNVVMKMRIVRAEEVCSIVNKKVNF